MKRIFRLASVLVLLTALSGCGYIDYYLLPPPEDTAQELFEAGQDAMNSKQYGDAAEYFQKLKDRYPFSPYTPKAEIGLGDAYYLDEEYALAADAYKEFEALHPRHEEIPYVLFQIGMSDFKTVSSIDMPQDHVSEAIEYFNRLIETYPDSPYVAEARKYIVESRRLMAEHEIFVADFYWRTQRYKAAWERYEYIQRNFTDLEDIIEYAESRGKMAYLRYKESGADKERRHQEGSWKDYFDWL